MQGPPKRWAFFMPQIFGGIKLLIYLHQTNSYELF